MGETVDVLVMGGNYGSGHRSGGVSTLICGVIDNRGNDDNSDEGETRYVELSSVLRQYLRTEL
jgi:DNA ligase-4